MTTLKSMRITPLKLTKVLSEALPYIEKYNGKTVVIKLGGNTMPELNNAIEDIILLKSIGINPIIVHGGGPEIDKELKKIKIIPKFINGLRYTDNTIIRVIEIVFDKINKRIVNKLIAHRAKSIKVNNCIKVKQKSRKLGLVGEITEIYKNKILKALKSGSIPVISPVGIGNDCRKYNINADTVASHIAVALKAEKLTILTNVDGIIIDGKILPHINFETAKKEIKKGTINKGMIPKVEACIYAVKNKCPKAHLINGLTHHSLLLEIFTDKGIGTEMVYKNGHKKSH